MNGASAREWLTQGLRDLALARQHLDFSYQRVADLPTDLKDVTPDQLESVEAFCSRFARVVDLLVNKVLRALDRIELLSQGTLLDVVNRAEQRGLVESATALREMKDVRNVIAHDYAGSRLAEVFTFCRDNKPALDVICDRVREYAEDILRKS